MGQDNTPSQQFKDRAYDQEQIKSSYKQGDAGERSDLATGHLAYLQ